MDYHKLISKLYDFFYYKVYRQAGHKLHDNPVNKKQIQNFITLLANHYQLPSVGVNYLIDYFCFTFAIRSEQETKRNITLNWIIGKKMFQRWLSKPDEYQWQYKKFLKEHDINIDQIRNQLYAHDDMALPDDSVEDLEKQRVTDDGRLYNCMLHTTLFNHKSNVCILCSKKSLCKRVLKETYPDIYRRRGYK